MHRAESRGAFTVLSQLAGCCILEDILLLLLRTMARPARATRGKQERGVLLVEHLAPLRQELGSLGIFGLFLSQNTRTRLGTTRLNASELRFGRAARARVFCLRSICAWGSCASSTAPPESRCAISFARIKLLYALPKCSVSHSGSSLPAVLNVFLPPEAARGTLVTEISGT